MNTFHDYSTATFSQRLEHFASWKRRVYRKGVTDTLRTIIFFAIAIAFFAACTYVGGGPSS